MPPRPPKKPFRKGPPRGDGPSRSGGGGKPFRKGGPPRRDAGAAGDRPFRKGPPRRDGGGAGAPGAGEERPFRKGPPRRDGGGAPAGGRPFRKGPPRDGGGDRTFRKSPPRDGGSGDRPVRKGPPRDSGDRPARKGPPRGASDDRGFRKGPARDGDRPARSGPPRERAPGARDRKGPPRRDADTPPPKRKPTPEEIKRRRAGADWELMSRKELAAHVKGAFAGAPQKTGLAGKRPGAKAERGPEVVGPPGRAKDKKKLRREAFVHEGPAYDGAMRIQKIISIAGLASRREAEEMIEQGRVMVNDLRATLGQKVDLQTDKVVVDGSRLRLPEGRVTYVLNKPRGYVSTRDDERGRRTVLDLITGSDRYLYPVGRLDYDTEGLMLLTNDGELANGLTHPRNQVTKTYRAMVDRSLDDEQLGRLRRGIHLEDGPTRPCEVELHKHSADGFWYEIVIREGRNRQVRRMFGAVGAGVRRLVRVAIGPLRLAELPAGAYRPITPEELRLLKEAYGHHSVPPR